MDKENKEANVSKLSVDPKGRSRSFYLSPEGTPKQMAKKGLIIILVMIIPSRILGGPLGAIIDIFTTYGVILLLIALFKWIKNKGPSKLLASIEPK